MKNFTLMVENLLAHFNPQREKFRLCQEMCGIIKSAELALIFKPTRINCLSIEENRNTQFENVDDLFSLFKYSLQQMKA